MSDSSPRTVGGSSRISSFVAIAALASVAGLGCGSSSPVTGGVGYVTGAEDNHCTVPTVIVQETNPASCNPPRTDAGAVDAGGADASADDAGVAPPFGDTQYNFSGDDDDCKYHVVFNATPVKVNQNVTFKLTITHKSDGSPATGAVTADGNGLYIQAYENDMQFHVLPNPAPSASETKAGSGIYTIGPAKFDEGVRWVVRFHMFGNCEDTLEDSPHGHVAFFVDVPAS